MLITDGTGYDWCKQIQRILGLKVPELERLYKRTCR
jgi:hypothetical protein